MAFEVFALYWILIGVVCLAVAMLDRDVRVIFIASGPIERLLGAAFFIAFWQIVPMGALTMGIDWCWKRAFGWSLLSLL